MGILNRGKKILQYYLEYNMWNLARSFELLLKKKIKYEHNSDITFHIVKKFRCSFYLELSIWHS